MVCQSQFQIPFELFSVLTSISMGENKDTRLVLIAVDITERLGDESQKKSSAKSTKIWTFWFIKTIHPSELTKTQSKV